MIAFRVYGEPIPQGSMKALMLKGMKFPIVVSDNTALKGWRKKVGAAAKEAMRVAEASLLSTEIPVAVRLEFLFKRPPSTDRQFPTVRPDIDKLERAILDALTGIVWTDDSQVVSVTKSKLYGEFEQAAVFVNKAGVWEANT